VAGQLALTLEEDLTILDRKIAQLGGLAEHVLGQAIDALSNRDPDRAEDTFSRDLLIDRMERSVEDLAIATLAKYHPVSGDVRHIITAIRIASDLERVGDLCKNIAKRAIAVAPEQPPMQLISGFKHIGEITMQQLKDVLDAYSQRDAAKAARVWRQDNDVDAVYNSLFRELLNAIMNDPENIGVYTHLLFSAKNLERIGDHATNIAETAFFFINGTALSDERPSIDTTVLPLILRSAPRPNPQ
jgi:phosphate transport system protein